MKVGDYKGPTRLSPPATDVTTLAPFEMHKSPTITSPTSRPVYVVDGPITHIVEQRNYNKRCTRYFAKYPSCVHYYWLG